VDLGFATSNNSSLRLLAWERPSERVGRDAVTIKVSLGSSIANKRPQATGETDALKAAPFRKSCGHLNGHPL
jgi:hypothetical protein